MRLQIKDLKKVVSLVLGVFALWPPRANSERLPANERMKQKLPQIKTGGHDRPQLSEACRRRLCFSPEDLAE